MIKYELKKVFCKRVNRLLLLVLLGLTLMFSYFAVTGNFYVDESGVEHMNFGSVRKLTEDRNKWRGELTPEVIRRVVEKRQKLDRIYRDNIPNDVYGKEIQGYDDVVHLVNAILRADGEYHYTAVLQLKPEAAEEIYRIRERNIQKMISIYGKTDRQKDFLQKNYDKVQTPFYYEPYEPWDVIYRYTNILGLIMALLLTILVAGVFADEFQTKADAVFFSTKLGKSKAIWGKIGAVLALVTGIYWTVMLLFSLICLGIMGISGHSVSYRIYFTYSLYPLTFFQIHMLILWCEYVACLLAAAVAMLVAARTKKVALAIFVPFLLLAVSPFVARELPFKVFFQLTPDQLMNVNNCLRIPYLYEVFGVVFRQIPFLALFYSAASLLLLPVIYRTYSVRK